MPKNLQRGASGFTSHPKEGVLWILYIEIFIVVALVI
jgi:hypothetical protein